ncbi:MAG: hypothetical protein KJO34_05470 [Deltaproteobacteria bacterium]|nr:hypothetical protein [Deltaproteobacteria bacterium]
MIHAITVEELRKFAEKFVTDEPGRLGTDGWWQTPLLATAPTDHALINYRRLLPMTTSTRGIYCQRQDPSLCFLFRLKKNW